MHANTRQAYIRHPELAAARANRDYIIDKLEEAVHQIESVAMEKHHRQANNACGDIAAALDQFDVSFISLFLTRLITTCHSFYSTIIHGFSLLVLLLI